MKEIAVCGCPRSGTTALVRLLNLSDKTFITNELSFYGSYDLEKRYQIVKELQSKNYDVSWIPYCKSNIAIEINDRYQLNVIGDKTPDYVLKNNFDFIRKNYPQVKFIFCFRCCRDFVCSSLNAFDKTEMWAHSSIIDACDMWYNYTKSAFDCIDELPDNSFACIKYESMTDRQIVNNIEIVLNEDLRIHPIPLNSFLRDKYYRYNFDFSDEIKKLDKKVRDFC